MKTLIKNVVIIQKDRKFNGSILIEEGIIKQIFEDKNHDIKDAKIINGNGLLLAPGMVDIHLHGSYGHDFIDNPQKRLMLFQKDSSKKEQPLLASLTVLSHEKLYSF